MRRLSLGLMLFFSVGMLYAEPFVSDSGQFSIDSPADWHAYQSLGFNQEQYLFLPGEDFSTETYVSVTVYHLTDEERQKSYDKAYLKTYLEAKPEASRLSRCKTYHVGEVPFVYATLKQGGHTTIYYIGEKDGYVYELVIGAHKRSDLRRLKSTVKTFSLRAERPAERFETYELEKIGVSMSLPGGWYVREATTKESVSGFISETKVTTSNALYYVGCSIHKVLDPYSVFEQNRELPPKELSKGYAAYLLQDVLSHSDVRFNYYKQLSLHGRQWDIFEVSQYTKDSKAPYIRVFHAVTVFEGLPYHVVFEAPVNTYPKYESFLEDVLESVTF